MPPLPRKPYAYLACLWLVLVAIWFAPVIFQGKVIAPLDIMQSLLRPWATTETVSVHNAFTYDAVSQYLPYDWSVYQSLKQDGYIGWNPNTHSGSSIVENTMVCPRDWHHHLYRFLPFWTAWNIGIIAQFSLGGLGLLLLLRGQKLPAAYSLIGLIAFGFNSQFILWINHRWVLGAMCWAPWILWALLRAKKSGRVIDLPSIALIALAFRGGHLQTCLFVVLLVILIALADWWKSDNRCNLRETCKIIGPYAVSGCIASIFALDVIVETIPALLHGKRAMESRGWLATLSGLPTLATSLFPNIMGSPQGLDLMKMFRIDLFSIKFMGALALLLAVLGFFRRQAPLPAKVLFLVGLMVPFTPLDYWLYSRFTVIFALGGAWLAVWYLTQISNEPPSKIWKRSAFILGAIATVWLLGSLFLISEQSWIQAKLHEVVTTKLHASKASRADWMLMRADRFFQDSLIWAPRNLIMLLLLGGGLFACSRIHRHHPKAPSFALLAALCTFGEILLFSSTWVTFSNKPAGGGLYAEPVWASQLKAAVGNGRVHLLDRSDFDYMQLNTPSAYGIRFSDGYETVTPKRIDLSAGESRDPARCAASGISHLLISPKSAPASIPGWDKVIDSPELVLFQNPLFKSIYTAELASGETLPLSPSLSTPNRRELSLPPGVTSVTFMESFNPGWKYAIEGQPWQSVDRSEQDGIRITLAAPTSKISTRLHFQYRPAYQSYYHPIMAVMAAGLFGFSACRAKRRKQG